MHSIITAALLAASCAAESNDWKPHFEIKGAYEGPVCETTAFWWPKTKKMYLMESICKGPQDPVNPKNPYGYTWSHAEQWDSQYLGHSYIRIREMGSGNIISNISHSIGFSFGAAFVDYDHDMLWISATANDRQHNNTRPYGPPATSCGHWECGVWVFNSSDLTTWTR
jgi:hypothetical protein